MLQKALFGYRRRPLCGGSSHFQLLYGLKPRLLSSDESCDEKPNSLQGLEMELLAVLGQSAARAEHRRTSSTVRRDKDGFQIGLLVLIA